jgi:hypothetical protein
MLGAHPAKATRPVSIPVLEAIMLRLDARGVHHLHPTDAATLLLAWQDDLHPAEVVVDGVAMHGLSPFLVHSTSWRMDRGTLVLSFIVAVEAEGGAPARAGLVDDLVGRVDLARGNAMGPPTDVEPHHVVEHGLRHLAWLVRDDPGIHDALPEWVAALADYEPEPFRAFG